MKTQIYSALVLILTLTTAQLSCDSKTTNKAENVARANQDVAKAQQAGETKEEVMAKQAKVDSARKDYKKTWDAARDDMRRKINKTIANIDKKTAEANWSVKNATGDAKVRLVGNLTKLKKERATLTGLLTQLDQVEATNWETTRRAIRTVKDGVDTRVRDIRSR